MRLKDRRFQTHGRHCVVSLSKTLYPHLSTGSTEENRKLSPHDRKIVDLDVKQQHKQTFLMYTRQFLPDFFYSFALYEFVFLHRVFAYEHDLNICSTLVKENSKQLSKLIPKA